MTERQRTIAAGEVGRDRPAARLARPLRAFLETETSGGVVLVTAVAVALVWANSPWSGLYQRLWATDIELRVGAWALALHLREWVNDGLMVIFFFVVGLEIKRELVVGELNSARKASLPAIAALGGMVLPAAIYLVLNAGGDRAHGWGIPIATDIALALGVLALVGGVPDHVRVLLLSLAIVDDVGAVTVIAIFYSEDISWVALGAAAGLLVGIALLRSIKVWWVPIYVVVGAALWLAVLVSGVHATIAGVALGLMAPARPLAPGALKRSPLPQQEESDDGLGLHEARAVTFRATASVAVTERLANRLHPWTSFLILPLFALANAGLPLSVGQVVTGLGSTVAWGIVAGLVVGKVAGIAGSSWLATRFGARLPEGVAWRHVLGMSAVAGIGFTMSLFITGLAFSGELVDQAKFGVLLGSTIAATVGGIVLRAGTPRAE